MIFEVCLCIHVLLFVCVFVHVYDQIDVFICVTHVQWLPSYKHTCLIKLDMKTRVNVPFWFHQEYIQKISLMIE